MLSHLHCFIIHNSLGNHFATVLSTCNSLADEEKEHPAFCSPSAIQALLRIQNI